MKRIIVVLYTFIFIYSSYSQNLLQQADSTAMQQWVDSVMLALSPDQRLGQLLMPQIVGGNTPDVKAQIEQQLKEYHVGGIFFSKGTIDSQNALTQHAQMLAKEKTDYCGGLPLLIGIDGEWGLAMRLSDAPKFPRNKALSNINASIRDTLCYLYGKEIARECRLLGIHVNFAPVLDINSNPKNPVIGTRSFGETAEAVTSPALAYAQGLESGGVLSCGKHFPGHGDTDVDSHKALPRLSHSRELMFERELKPFHSYVEAGLGSLMVAHLNVPSLSGKEGVPSTASKEIVNDILRKEMGFEGLVFTDGLAMKGASNYPDICAKALLAGNDILLQPYPIERQWKELIAARNRGDLTQEIIDGKCRRILAWKYALIIANPMRTLPVQDVTLQEQINSDEAKKLAALLTKLSQDSTSTTIELDPTQQTDSSLKTSGLDSIAAICKTAIAHNAFPGCQVLVAQHGKIIYNECFGYLDNREKQPVSHETRYDLASVTKAMATLPAMMLIVDKYGVKLTDKISKYVEELKGTDKENITVQQALFHETGLRSSYLFYTLTLDSASIDNRLYSAKRQGNYTIQQDRNVYFHKGLKFSKKWISDKKDETYSLQVTPSMYVRNDMRDSIVSKIVQLKLKNPGRYTYSDLNFVLLRVLIERVSEKPIDKLLETGFPEIYGNHLCYQPLSHGVALHDIAPTEDDQALRHTYLRGTVHDETAAWSGGIEGNAGLFGTAEALFPLCQMMLDEGRIGERQAIKPSTIKNFTTSKSKVSRRGLGFDKPETDPKKISPCFEGCDPSVFGHTGYTGPCFWIDPKKEIVFIMLCNRVNEHRWNRTLMTEGIRDRIHSCIEKALK